MDIAVGCKTSDKACMAAVAAMSAAGSTLMVSGFNQRENVSRLRFSHHVGVTSVKDRVLVETALFQ